MSEAVHRGPDTEDQRHDGARGTAYTGDPGPDEGDEPAPQLLPLDAWHRARGARMVPFAGYEMPIQYDGIMVEHRWTRDRAGLFDVSHMGQLLFSGEGADRALEAVLPGDIVGLGPNRMRYSLLLSDNGGIVDDLIVTRRDDGIYMVVNGATKYDDVAYLLDHMPDEVTINLMDDQALLALQGPMAVDALSRLVPGVERLVFMTAGAFEWRGVPLWISRSGYTGEDGFEVSLPGESAEAFADALLADEDVRPIGLGARDSLRLEAGLPLYGHDLDHDTSPIMADLGFAVAKRRREARDFLGAERILLERDQGPIARRVGLVVEGRQPVREGAGVVDDEGTEVGRVTSGGFAPTLGAPIAMAYVPAAMAAPGSAVTLVQRGKLHRATVAPMPFVPHRYVRAGA